MAQQSLAPLTVVPVTSADGHLRSKCREEILAGLSDGRHQGKILAEAAGAFGDATWLAPLSSRQLGKPPGACHEGLMAKPDENWFDPDIDAMHLDYGEKAGLQIYRNYTRAFEDHAIKRFRDVLKREPFDLAALKKINMLLVDEDIRFLPVIVCAYGDELLESTFRDMLPDGIPGGKASMFGPYGPLSDLSKRIRLAYAFDILSPDLLKELDHVRAARNTISHTWDSHALKDFYIASRVSELFPVEGLLEERGRLSAILVSSLDSASAFRVRLVWIVGRLTYEAAAYQRAKRARLEPARALYLDEGTSWLADVATECMTTTTKIVGDRT